MELYLLTGYNGFYGQSRKPWVSLSTPTLIKELRGCGLTVHTADWHDLASGSFNPRDSNILYTFSQLTHIRAWLKDQLHFLGSTTASSPRFPFCYATKTKAMPGFTRRARALILPGHGIFAIRVTSRLTCPILSCSRPYPEQTPGVCFSAAATKSCWTGSRLWPQQ